MTDASGTPEGVTATDAEVAKAQVEQALQIMILTEIETQKVDLDFPDESKGATAIALAQFLKDLVQSAVRGADRENVRTVDLRHVKEAARELHLRKKADWIRAFGMLFLGSAVSQLIRMQSTTPSLTDANILAVLFILAFALLMQAATKEKPSVISVIRLGRGVKKSKGQS